MAANYSTTRLMNAFNQNVYTYSALPEYITSD